MFEYYTLGLIALLAAASPGPDFAIVLRNSLTHHQKAGILTALGIGAGILVHTTYCVLGIALIISESVWLFNIIKFVGATYIIYLGVMSLLAKKTHNLEKINAKQMTTISDKRAFLNGFITNVLNPKCTLFMLSIFTLMVKPNTPISVQITYGIEIALIAVAWFIFLSCVLNRRWVKQRLESVQHQVTKIMGVALVCLGIWIMTASTHVA